MAYSPPILSNIGRTFRLSTMVFICPLTLMTDRPEVVWQLCTSFLELGYLNVTLWKFDPQLREAYQCHYAGFVLAWGNMMRKCAGFISVFAGILLPLGLSGCASHTIYNKEYEAGGVSGAEYRLPHVSVLGDKGVESQSGGRIAKECDEKGMAKVAVRRSFGQTLATLLTLGIVNPVTISYQCQVGGADDPQPGDPDDF